jgi:hypothetical protein
MARSIESGPFLLIHIHLMSRNLCVHSIIRPISTVSKVVLIGPAAKATFDEIMAAGIKNRVTPDKILCDLLEAEMAERKVRSMRYRN